MTGQELVDRVKSNVGNRSDKDTEILQAVNDAIQRISALHRWDINESTDTIALVTDQESYSLPANTSAVISLFLELASGDFEMLQAVSTFRLDRVFKANGCPSLFDLSGVSGDHADGSPVLGYHTKTGIPQLYSHWAGGIVVYPIPTASENGLDLYVRISTRPSEILVGGTNPLGDKFDRLVIAFATADVCAMLSLWDDSRGWESRAHMLLREVQNEEKERPDWTPRTGAGGRSLIP